VLLPETDFGGAFVVAEKVRIGAEEVGLTGSVEMPTSVSIGLVSCPEDGTSVDELMIAADRAMYQAKSLGKNQVSGNPRPRRLLYRAPEEAQSPPPTMTALPIDPDVEEAQPASEPAAATRLSLEAPLVVPVSRVGVPVVERALAGTHADAATDEEEPDPSEVRRNIAAAQRNMDPDHQIRRAMDAFLSPTRINGD
jgi:hypothetical protein